MTAFRNLILSGIVLLLPIIVSSQASSENFFSTDKVHQIDLSFDNPDWVYLLDSLMVQGDGYLLASVKLDGQNYDYVGVRYRGDKTFQTGNKRNAFDIKLNYVNKKQNHKGYKSLSLSNALRDPSMLREVMGFEIAGTYLPTPQAAYTNLSINGNNHGLFVSLEPINKQFLEKHYGNSSGTFLKAKQVLPNKVPPTCKNNIYGALEWEEDVRCYMANYDMLSEEGWDDLMELTRILNQEPTKIETILHVDRVLWMLAFNNVTANLRSYSGKNSNSFYLYQDSLGLFNPIISDLNLAFGSFKNTGHGSDLSVEEIQKLDPLLHLDHAAKPLIGKLLIQDEYRKIYLDHIRTIIYDYFVNGEYEKRAKELQALIQPSFAKDPYQSYSLADFNNSLSETIGKKSKIPGLISLMTPRARFLKKHPEIAIFPPQVDKVTLARREKFSTEKVNKFDFTVSVKNRADQVKLVYRPKGNQAYQTVYLKDDGQSNDKEAGDKIFGISIDPKGEFDTLEYFFILENAKAAGFYPRNYMNEPRVTTLAELNK